MRMHMTTMQAARFTDMVFGRCRAALGRQRQGAVVGDYLMVLEEDDRGRITGDWLFYRIDNILSGLDAYRMGIRRGFVLYDLTGSLSLDKSRATLRRELENAVRDCALGSDTRATALERTCQVLAAWHYSYGAVGPLHFWVGGTGDG